MHNVPESTAIFERNGEHKESAEHALSAPPHPEHPRKFARKSDCAIEQRGDRVICIFIGELGELLDCERQSAVIRAMARVADTLPEIGLSTVAHLGADYAAGFVACAADAVTLERLLNGEREGGAGW